ncbi:MAG: protease complex subunit PrcB family protein [Firmicutes bacterium]|nr:protease complex subunit PrcB family protein [Bacillota bacterium]
MFGSRLGKVITICVGILVLLSAGVFAAGRFGCFAAQEYDIVAGPETEIDILKQQIAKLEEAFAAEQAQVAVKTWAEGVKKRNGALQYAMLTPGLKAKMFRELKANRWTTGTSSPWVDRYEIIAQKVAPETAQFAVVFTYTDSTGSTFTKTENVTVTKLGGYWHVSAVNEKEDDFVGKVNFRQGIYRPDFDSLPEEIQNWVNCSLTVPAVQEKDYYGYRFVLVTEGVKPTGGYGVTITEARPKDGMLQVLVKSVQPGKDDMVTMALTYPYDLVIVENRELPLQFVDVDDADRYFMRLVGTDTIEQPVVAESAWIKVFAPAPGTEVEGAIKLTGIASVFEGTVSYELLDGKGDVVQSGNTMAAMGDWGYFTKELALLPGLGGQQLTLQLYSESAKDGSKAFVIDIPLTVK